jgi:pimeloyl-ACP methyl ester carboxylesterase/DNA-binding CsgD family transcriptional regulator
LIAPHWSSHLELDRDNPVRRHWLSALSTANTVLRYDLRGTGLSDRGVDDQSLGDWLDDTSAVLDAAGVDRCALLGVCQGGPIAVAFAARQPARARAVVLYGTYARCGPLGTRPPAEARAVDGLMRSSQELPGALQEVLARLLLPDATPPVVASFVALQQASARPADTARINAAHAAVDVTADAARVIAPTLVLHRRDDLFVPFEQGRILAALIPGSRFVPLQGRSHMLLPDEDAWPRLQSELSEFLGGELRRTADEVPLTNRQREILTLVAQGRGNEEIARRLFLSVRTVERHLSNIYGKLGVDGRAARAAAAVAGMRQR